MKIGFASDHAGYAYKEKLKAFVRQLGHEVLDFGTYSMEPVDYPLYIRPAAQAVADGRCERAIMLGGSGNGEAMVANRIRKVRCAVCWNIESARLAREHNNANAISIGGRLTDYELVEQMVKVWLETAFEGGRHERRIELMDLL